ncbi:hypothetical protein [Enterococcus gallinarum]|uniref:hypothetical protein n=1 Tax=Enterococcus gallinarum TaxID=1353 RepID=UPI0032E4FD80
MSKIFFAKMNINEDIYEVYNNKKNINKLLQKIYLNVKKSTVIHDEKGGRFKFFDIDKFEDNSVIHGRLGYIKKGVHSSYDPEKDTAIDTLDNNKIDYITFYFDVYNEMLAFTVTPSLTKKKVLKYFEDLIKKESDVGVIFILESDISELKVQLRKVKVLRKVSLNLVPPNGDKNQFANLFSLTSDKVAEAGATSIKQEYGNRSKEGLKKDSDLIEDATRGIGLGYAEGSFYGKDTHGEKVEIHTEKNTPYFKTVDNNQNKSKSIIAEKGRAGIIDLLAYKANIREKNKNGKSRKE